MNLTGEDLVAAIEAKGYTLEPPRRYLYSLFWLDTSRLDIVPVGACRELGDIMLNNQLHLIPVTNRKFAGTNSPLVGRENWLHLRSKPVILSWRCGHGRAFGEVKCIVCDVFGKEVTS